MPRLFLKLPITAERMKEAMAGVAEFADQPVVFGDPLPVHMDNVVDALRHCAARAQVREPIPISLNGSGRHHPILELDAIV
jgi:hypothetical protein